MWDIPHAMVPEGTSYKKVLGVKWVETTLIIKVNNNLPTYLHLTYFFQWIYNSTSNLEREWPIGLRLKIFGLNTQGITAPSHLLKLGKLENLKVLYFEILAGIIFYGGCIS